MKKSDKKRSLDPVQKELDRIKRLLILLLLKIDTQQNEISWALQIDPGDFSKMLPTKKIRPIKLLEKKS